MWCWMALFCGFPRLFAIRLAPFPRFLRVGSIETPGGFAFIVQIALFHTHDFPVFLHLRSIDGQNRVSAVADIHAALGQSIAAHERLAPQPERPQLPRELAHGERGNGLRGVENVPHGAEIELVAIGAERKLAEEKGIGEIGALEMRGAVARHEEKPETGIGDEGEGREVGAATPTVNQGNNNGTIMEQ